MNHKQTGWCSSEINSESERACHATARIVKKQCVIGGGKVNISLLQESWLSKTKGEVRNQW